MATRNRETAVNWPRWATFALVGMIGIVAGFGVRVYAQSTSTTEFRDPTCNPNDASGPSGCNTSSPLFLAPSSKDTAQIVQTPVVIGQTSANKNATLLGKLLLGETNDQGSAYSIQRAAQAGQAINVASTDAFALVASTATGTAALQASATGGSGDGIQATSVNGRGLYAHSISGPAAQFEGDVEIISGGLDVSGNINVVGTLTVDGSNVGAIANSLRDQAYPDPSGGVMQRTFDVNVGTTGVNLDLKTASYLNSSTFHVVGMDVMYDADTDPSDIFWRNANDTNYAEYQECSSGLFSGVLRLVAAADDTKMRVSLRYRAENPGCGAPQFTMAVDPGGNGYQGNFTFTTSSVSTTGTTTWAWDFGEDANNDIDCQSTNPSGTCAAAGGFIFTGTVANPIVRYPGAVTTGVKSAKLTLTDTVGATTKSVNVNVFKATFTVAQRPQVTQYVNITDTTNYGGFTDVSCRVDLKTDGSNDITPTAGTNCTDTANTVAHAYGTTFTETMRLFHPTCPGPTNECTSYTQPVQTVNPCTQSAQCFPGNSCCTGTIQCCSGSKCDDFPRGCYSPAACTCIYSQGDINPGGVIN